MTVGQYNPIREWVRFAQVTFGQHTSALLPGHGWV